MGRLERQILAEKENVEKGLDYLKDAKERREKTVIELAAIGTFLHNIYDGFVKRRFLCSVHASTNSARTEYQ